MSLKEQLTADMKDAMKAKEAGKQRLSVIRLVRGAVVGRHRERVVALSYAFSLSCQ